MARRFSSGKLVIASHNAGKVRELAELLAPFDVAVTSSAELGLVEPEETGATFEANAELKATEAANVSGMPALADDSGLVVPALDGAPGINSARWAGPGRDFRPAIARIEREMRHKHDHQAFFVCVLSLAWPDGHIESFEGRAEGMLVFPPRGAKGFGYDPIFQPTGYQITYAEMEPAAKLAINHRADAFKKLIAACFAAT
ncbi:MAG TPA: RdgB/HAM1 family non-canonical purine NTP pyrophosphatase [Alphaproteobacteria bacterium]|nr:RdgB/HAM1 family non-canonical purine NTP pyrophosphatase [Alphaproteobacteria bacterium]